jgi:NAD(P)-dependent dehydrogenase (short-subunit alcohol dehydrogenase family)
VTSRGLVLVTGAGKRLGAAIAQGLARDGWAIGVHYHSSERGAQEVAAAIVAKGGDALVCRADLAVQNEVDALAATLAKRGDWVGLVNSASTFERDSIQDISYTPAEAQLRTNLLAPIYLTRKLGEHLPQKARGFVVNIADQKVLNPNPDFLSYTVGKIALAQSTETLAMAMAPNIRVNAIAAGLMLVSGEQTGENFARVHAENLTGIGTRLEDVADGVAFLAGAENITGALLPVDGGQHLVPSSRDVMFT